MGNMGLDDHATPPCVFLDRWGNNQQERFVLQDLRLDSTDFGTVSERQLHLTSNLRHDLVG